METGAKGDEMPGENESETGTSSVGSESTVIERHGRVESADASNFTIKRDGEGESVPISKHAMLEAKERDEDFKVEARVAFTIPCNGSNVLSLETLDENEGDTDGGEAAKEADQATKDA